VEGDGVRQIFPWNQAIDQRLSRRLIERIYYTEEAGEHEDMPVENKIEIYRKPINECLNHFQNLRENKLPALLKAMRTHAADSAKEQPRNTIEETHDAQEKSGTGQMPHEPALRDVLHEIPGIGKQGPYNHEAKVAMP